MFAYCANEPINRTDSTGYIHVINNSDMVAQGGCADIGLGLLFPFVWLANVLTAPFSILNSHTEEEEKVEVVAATSTSTDSTYYYPADVRGSMTSPKVWKLYPVQMDFDTAIAWVVTTTASGEYGKNAYWGLYTLEQEDALKMATALGGAIPCLHDCNIGEHPHYHVAGMDLFGQYRHFHIWYGEENRG